MNTITQNIEAAAIVLIVSMALLTAALALRSGALKDIFEPSSNVSELPPLVRDTILDAEKGYISALPPWASIQKGERLARGSMKGECASLLGRKCMKWSPSGSTEAQPVGTYAIELPTITSVAKPDSSGWDAYQTAFSLSTQKQFTTGYPTQYPAATVIAVPNDTPKHVKFIMDAAGADSDGIKALVLENGQPLNMSVDQRLGLNNVGLNVSGNYAHAFVLVNQSDHDMFFVRSSIPLSDTGATAASYWRVPKDAWVLVWPSVTYWPNVGSPRLWNAFRLGPLVQEPSKAAYIAEVTMFEYLRPQAPV
jgi:hypothetical protein